MEAHVERGRGNVVVIEAVLGCKWTVQILGAISAGHQRPGQLRRVVRGISTKVLNERLAKLRSYGVLERRAYPRLPLHVEYCLTAKGRDLAKLIRQIDRFREQWDTREARSLQVRSKD